MARDDERNLARATWKSAEESIRTGRVTKVILPVGSLEQHGPHLPLSTDTIIAGYVAGKLSERCRDTFLMPTIQLSCSEEHIGFAGTVSLLPETMSSILLDISNSLLKSKLNHFFIINGHGGNRATIDFTIKKIRHVLPEMNVYCFTVSDVVKGKYEEKRKSRRRLVGHADEIETSMMLAIQPDLVDMSKAVSEEPLLPQALSFEQEDLAKISFSWNTRDVSKSGVIGNSLLADAENGRILLDFAVDTISEIISQL